MDDSLLTPTTNTDDNSEQDGLSRSVATLTVRELLDVLKQSIAEEHSTLKKDILSTVQEAFTEYDKSFKLMDQRIQKTENDISNVNRTASAAYQTSTTNATNIRSIQNTVDNIDPDYYQTQIQDFQKRISELEEETYDLRNRSMRSNLAFLGIKEDDRAGRPTHNIVADFLVEHLDVETHDATLDDIVRAHRGKQNGNNRAGGRPIYVKFARDDIAADYLRRSIEKQVTKKGFKVSQQFSAKVQTRRNAALQKRKELIASKQIIKGFVEYPAILKGMVEGEQGYKVIQTF